MKRIGIVVTFKPSVSLQQAEQALLRLADVMEVSSTVTVEHLLDNGRAVSYEERPRHGELRDLLHEYDDRDGGPVWYIP